MGLLLTETTPPTEYLNLKENQGYKYKYLQKVFRSYGEIIRKTKMFGSTSLPNLLSLTSQRTN